MKTKILQKRKLLVKRIDRLKRSFDFKQSINGITPQQEDKLRSFILLCHAELEYYLESIALLLLDNSIEIWKTKSIANYNFAVLFLKYGKKIESSIDINNLVFQICRRYKNDVDNNHGLKVDNINKLFGPLGYKQDDFATSFISELNSFGAGRGEIAHVSAYKATTVLDKKTVFDSIDVIMQELGGFETVITSKL